MDIRHRPTCARPLWLLAAILILVVVVAACGGSGARSSADSASQTTRVLAASSPLRGTPSDDTAIAAVGPGPAAGIIETSQAPAKTGGPNRQWFYSVTKPTSIVMTTVTVVAGDCGTNHPFIQFNAPPDGYEPGGELYQTNPPLGPEGSTQTHTERFGASPSGRVVLSGFLYRGGGTTTRLAVAKYSSR